MIATDLDTGDEVVFARGPLKPALLASAALPGVFPIVEHDGRRLVDGGVVNSVPLWHALAGPVDRVIVFNVSAGAADRERALAARRRDDELHALAQPALRARAAQHAAPRSRSIVLPRPPDPRELFDFSGGRELIDEAHRLASVELDRVAAEPDEPRERSRRRFRRRRRRAVPADAHPSRHAGRARSAASSWVASRANSRTTLGRMPRNTTPAAAIVSATPVPPSTAERGASTAAAGVRPRRRFGRSGAYIVSTMRR